MFARQCHDATMATTPISFDLASCYSIITNGQIERSRHLLKMSYAGEDSDDNQITSSSADETISE